MVITPTSAYRHRVRLLFFLLSLFLIFIAGVLHWTPWAATCKAIIMLVSYGTVFFGFIGAWLSFPDGLSTSRKIGLILLISLFARIMMMGLPVSDDVNRYLWEGKLVSAGESPYRYPGDHEHYAKYRDAYWKGMNHKDKLTAYPPLAELIFAAVSSVAYSPWAFKVLFTFVDLCIVGILICLLKVYGQGPRNVLLYALNPLTLFAIAGEAHFDVLLIFTMLLSVLCIEKRAYAWAWFWLGVSIQIKIIAVVLVPLYLWRCQWRYGWLLLITLAVPSLYFVETLPGMFHGLWDFGGMNAFNGPIHSPINYLLNAHVAWTTAMVSGLFSLTAFWIIRAVSIPVKAAYLLIAALVLFSPVVHYWYILWIIPFVVLYPGLSWLVLSFTSGAYFTSTFSVEQGGDWSLPVWAIWLIWLPFFLVLTYELRMVLLRNLRPELNWTKPETLAIIIPTLNEGGQIKACLEAVQSMQRPADEIFVCDGGSTDKTVAIAKEMGVCVVHSEPGRGTQIKAGVEAARSEVVLVIHADCICDNDVSQRIMSVLEKNPDVVGGAVGQRFNTSSMQLFVIEMLNDARAILGGASFGDQGQFFRVAALQKVGGFPGYPLMEDIEVSLRMMRTGRVVLLNGGVHNSARQWRQGFIKRIILIIKLVIIFRINRLLQRDVTEKLYAIYYNNRKQSNCCDNIVSK
ncbi:transferase 2, rSAM/selenodomain-associated [Nitrosomonas aestuarii]|uniref:Transferase 2, rSAM/selenodomain-associated n=1 Tax=Nitrosomonas aestuarii TaxID=52441 RepID=A0A1I4EQK1_9PROT|nr:glycosyltransferase [Nitrosomonas aestuarii]SFL08022.1 transferase 2, rSAM/selenodomain-associated [Nitrosomonas aestuarii]